MAVQKQHESKKAILPTILGVWIRILEAGSEKYSFTPVSQKLIFSLLMHARERLQNIGMDMRRLLWHQENACWS